MHRRCDHFCSKDMLTPHPDLLFESIPWQLIPVPESSLTKSHLRSTRRPRFPQPKARIKLRISAANPAQMSCRAAARHAGEIDCCEMRNIIFAGSFWHLWATCLDKQDCCPLTYGHVYHLSTGRITCAAATATLVQLQRHFPAAHELK